MTVTAASRSSRRRHAPSVRTEKPTVGGRSRPIRGDVTLRLKRTPWASEGPSVTVTQIVYASESASRLALADLRTLHDVCQRHNAAAKVTGVLAYGAGWFVQCIEAEMDVAHAVFLRVLRDPRHVRPVVLGVREVDRRTFNTWSMVMWRGAWGGALPFDLQRATAPNVVALLQELQARSGQR